MVKDYMLGLYEKAMPGNLSWEEKFNIAKEAGYDYIEISIDESDEKLGRLDMTLNERMKLNMLMASTGVKIRSMCLSGHRKYPMGSSDPKIQKKSMEIMEKAIQLADDLGVRTIQLAGYDVYYDESTEKTKKIFLENLKKATKMAAAYGIALGFETMENEFMNTVEKAMKYVTLTGSAYLGVYPDLGNITNAANTYRNDVLEDLELSRNHIISMHLKETVPGKFREVPFGTGYVDFEAGVKKAWELGVRRYVTEFWYIGSPSWKEDIISVSKMFHDILDRQN